MCFVDSSRNFFGGEIAGQLDVIRSVFDLLSDSFAKFPGAVGFDDHAVDD
jgi:hypothetical protein